MQQFILILLFTFSIFFNSLMAQSGRIGGTVTNKSAQPMPGIEVKLIGAKFQTTTNTDNQGSFTFSNIYSGTYSLVIREPEHFEYNEEIEYIQGEDLKLDDIQLERINSTKDVNIELPMSQVFDDESNNNSIGNDISSLLNASRDPYVSAASFNFSQGGFRLRGYENYQDLVLVNGIPMQNLFRGGDVAYGDFSGLNDVLRSRNVYLGTKAIPFSFGNLATTTEIDAEAINQRKGLRLSYMLTNRNFRHRAMATYNSGLIKKNWAFTVSGSFRGAKEGYVVGTAMESFAGFASVSKIWNQKINSTLTAFASRNFRSVQGSAIQEAMDLYGSNFYNPSWGWQDGEKRSANLRKDLIPNIILSNEWKPNRSTTINFSIGYQFGKHQRIGFDWFNTYNPNPTYYKKLPSFWIDNPILYDSIKSAIKNDKNLLQINWQDIYDYNQNNIDSIPQAGIRGRYARVLLSSQTEEIRNFTANLVVNKKINETIEMHGGILFQNALNEQYREITDLLGADFFMNINQFAERADPSNPNAKFNNLKNPYEVLRVGDKYGYHFLGRITSGNAFLQFLFNIGKTDFYVSGNLMRTTMQRNGYMQNGAYADVSFGNSEEIGMWNYGFKTGFTYKVNGRNYISSNLLYTTRPREFSQVFILPRTTNLVSKNLANPQITSLEASYNYRGPKVKFSTNLYITETRKEATSMNFFTELTNSFGSMITDNIARRYMGIEASADIQLVAGFSTTLAGTLADHEYILRPNNTFYYDNLNRAEPTELVFFHGLHTANGPQNATMARLNYSSKQFWNASVSINYFGRNFVEPSVQRRTTEAIDNIPLNSDLYYKIIKQGKLNDGYTVDVSWRKSFYLNKFIKGLKKRMYFDLNLSINNIFDRQDIIRNSREQLRFDFRDNNPDKFPDRAFYMMGRNYAAIATFRF